MTLYLDTSSVVKLYFDEADREDVLQMLAYADSAATSSVTYAEARATFARRYRERGISATVFRAAKHDLDADWPAYVLVEAAMPVCRAAGELAERYHLRGFDAIHLASFAELARTSPDDVEFSSFDRRLNRAAASVRRSLKRRTG